MSTTLNELAASSGTPPVATQYLDADGHANVALLQDRMPAALRLSRGAVILTLALGGLFITFSYAALWHTDLWGHLSYGRWIAAEHAVPRTEPLLPLAKGVPFVDTAWLSQLIGFGMFERFGVSGIQFLYASSFLLVAGVLTSIVYRRTQSVAAALLALGAFYWVAYQQLLVVRPQLAGMVCFTLVFAMITAPEWKRWFTFAIPLVFMAWANLHGSFLVGLVMLGLFTVGRGIDVWLHSKNWRTVLAERGTRGLLLATELSAAAVLLNPYGIGIYPEVLQVSGSRNLESLVEWEPLTLRMKQGQAAACVVLALICAYRLTPRRVTVREVLLLALLGLGMMWYCRMIVWFAPVAAYYLAVHAIAIWRHWRKQPAAEPTYTGLRTIIVVGVAWICFAYTPFGYTVLHGQIKDPKAAEAKFRKSLSTQTPVELTRFLNREPPTGQVFNSYEWGDYLLWAGPKEMKLFVNSHAHLIPEEVWDDYLQIANGANGWMEKLDRYGVNAVVVDAESRGGLIRELEKQSGWEKKYKDYQGAVFYRKKPI
ncbi:hypothetical protein [Planctomicrobium sp. SH664]|uniref:hypothetical protein n=1 Tax=Planctomicrobium sp. SH664 TaxID=3448125 RepID=UPI003F5B2D06